MAGFVRNVPGSTRMALACAVLLLAAACEPLPTYPRSGVVGPKVVDALDTRVSFRPPTDCDTLVEEMKADARARLVLPLTAAAAPTTTTRPAPTTATSPTSTVVVAGFSDGPNRNGPVRTAEFGFETFTGARSLDLPRNVVLHNNRLYVVRWGVLRAFDVSTDTPRELGALDLGESVGDDRWNATLLLRDDTLYVFGRSAVVAAVALDRVGAPVAVSAELRIDGWQLEVADVRDETAYVVVLDRVKAYSDVATAPEQAATREAMIASSVREDWLSTYSLTRGDEVSTGLTVPCRSIDRPAEGSASSRTALLAIDLSPDLGPPSGRAFPGGVDLPIRSVVEDTIEVGSSAFRPPSLSAAEQALLRGERQEVVRELQVDRTGALRVGAIRLDDVVDYWCWICDDTVRFDLGAGRTATIRLDSDNVEHRAWTVVTISETTATGASRTVAEARYFDLGFDPYQRSNDGPGVRWDADARRVTMDVGRRLLTVDVDDPLLIGSVVSDVSSGQCGASSYTTVSDGERVWLIDDSIRTFDRDDMAERSRLDLPRPSSYGGSLLPICD